MTDRELRMAPAIEFCAKFNNVIKPEAVMDHDGDMRNFLTEEQSYLVMLESARMDAAKGITSSGSAFEEARRLAISKYPSLRNYFEFGPGEIEAHEANPRLAEILRDRPSATAADLAELAGMTETAARSKLTRLSQAKQLPEGSYSDRNESEQGRLVRHYTPSLVLPLLLQRRSKKCKRK
jgi:hypothetical protein